MANTEKKELVIFDTNAYRYLVANKSFDEIDKFIVKIKSKEKQNNIETLISPIVTKELLAHIADKNDPSYEKCLKANKALFLHSGSAESYRMIASPELLLAKAFFDKTIPSKELTNQALGQISFHLATNPTDYVFTKFQHNLNLNRQHVFDSEIHFAMAMLDFVRATDHSAKGWRIFENDEAKRRKVLEEIRSEKVSIDIALGFLVVVYHLLLTSGQLEELPFEELVKRAHKFIEIFPEPIALNKLVMENLVNSEFNLLENSRSNFVWDIHLMFNVGNMSIKGCKINFVTDDKAIIRTAMANNSKYTIHTFDEYMAYIN